MPTAYTAEVQKGISFEQFVMLCARAMGACIDMRDAPLNASIPDRFEPSLYHQQKLEDANKRLAQLHQMSLQDAEVEAQQAHELALAAHNERVKEMAETRKRYLEMLDMVEQWEPPTKDHQGLQEFMYSQLSESLRFDCGWKDRPEPERLTAEQWKQEQINLELENIRHHANGQREEFERVESRNAWLKALRDSFKQKGKA